MVLRAIGVDVGGTKLAIGGVDVTGTLVGYREQGLPSAGYQDLVTAIATATQDLVSAYGSEPWCPLGVAVAGWLSPDRNTVVTAANLGWSDRPLGRDIAAATGMVVTLHNDGDAAAWGEFTRAGRPDRGAFVMLTLGTDVGGGVITNGRLLTGANGVAGELGHLRVSDAGPPCVCGARGCLSVYASGNALRAAAQDAVASGRWPGSALASACHGDAKNLTSTDLSDAVAAADPAALEVLAAAAAAVAAASAQVSRVLDHHTLVIGGGASRLGGPLLTAIHHALHATAPLGPVHSVPAVRLAQAGNEAGVLGAADLATLADPEQVSQSHPHRTRSL